jgi:hypothetical protein
MSDDIFPVKSDDDIFRMHTSASMNGLMNVIIKYTEFKDAFEDYFKVTHARDFKIHQVNDLEPRIDFSSEFEPSSNTAQERSERLHEKYISFDKAFDEYVRYKNIRKISEDEKSFLPKKINFKKQIDEKKMKHDTF